MEIIRLNLRQNAIHTLHHAVEHLYWSDSDDRKEGRHFDHDEHMVSWLEWAYCACGDPTGSGTVEALVYNPKQPPAGTNVNTDKLKILDEPYPLAIAGVPLGFHYESGTNTFTFRYQTTAAGGGHFPDPATTTTDIYIPALHYPAGYRVNVTGAQVVSSAGASTLQLVAGAGAATVSVVVTP